MAPIKGHSNAECLAYAHWFAEEGYRDHVRRIWWTPRNEPLPSLRWIEDPECLCYDTVPGVHSLCRYCSESCPPPAGSVILPSDEEQQH